MAYQFQTQSPEKVSHLEAKQNTEKCELFLATMFESGNAITALYFKPSRDGAMSENMGVRA
jgi:hypothetical protein